MFVGETAMRNSDLSSQQEFSVVRDFDTPSCVDSAAPRNFDGVLRRPCCSGSAVVGDTAWCYVVLEFSGTASAFAKWLASYEVADSSLDLLALFLPLDRLE
jgi:hypothetical protein